MAPALVSDMKLPPNGVPESKETPAASPISKAFSLEDKTILITGGGRGLGITLALAVLEAGGNVACLDILDTPAPTEWAELTKAAGTGKRAISYHRCDVTNEAAVEEVMGTVESEAEAMGSPFWGVIACAGVQQQIPAMEYPSAEFDRVFEVNVTGVFNTCKHAARTLHARKRPGSIVVIASMSGNIANRGLECTAYNSSKAAVQQMCRSVAQEWGRYGIRVNTLSPGYIRTDMTDQLLEEDPEVEKTWMEGALLGRLGAPEDFKAPAVFLLSEGAAFVHGADLRVDGGHCVSA